MSTATIGNRELSTDSFRVAMRSAGLDYTGQIIADGNLHRFKSDGDKARNSWFIMFPGPPTAGAFGCWKRDIKETWCEGDARALSPADGQRVREQWQRADAERERAQAERHAEARAEAAQILKDAKPPQSHAYLDRKAARVFGDAREHGGKLVLPLRDANGELHSLQNIGADGSKGFLTGGRVAGCFFTVCANPDGPLVLCEGYATGATIHEATGHAAICAMNCGNLKAVAESLRAKWPGREIILAADNDEWTAGNPGLGKATEAAKAIRAKLAIPQFKDTSTQPTDFNDLHQLEGLAAVKEQIEAAATPAQTDEERLQRLATLSPMEFDRVVKKEARAMGVKMTTLRTEVERRRPKQRDAGLQGAPMEFADPEPWECPVHGAELLEEIASTYRRFCLLPQHAAELLAAWILQTYCYRQFQFAAIVAVWSPEPECGKGRVLDVTEVLACHPFRTANTSPAVLYHSVAKGDLTVLIDEFDSHHPEQRETIGNILKSGFQANGKAHRMTERNGEQVVVEFSTYCPKMLATVGLDALDKASRTRAIGIRMQRKPREAKLEKFRRFDGTDIRRKCLRWAQDNAEAVQELPPMEIAECATDRQEDVWEPLVGIARLAGGGWEARIRDAAAALSGKASDAAVESISHQVLAAINEHFAAGHTTRATTKELVEYLAEVVDVSSLSRGRGLSASLLARLLKPYGIESRNIKTPDGKVAKGYHHDDFAEAISVYLHPSQPGNPVSARYPATKAENIERASVFAYATTPQGSVSRNAIPTNKDRAGSGVADQMPETAANAPAEAMLL